LPYDEYQTFDFKIEYIPLGSGQYKMQGWIRMHAAASWDEMWHLNWPYKWQWNKAINNVANPEDAWVKIGGHQPDGGERIISGCDFSAVYPFVIIANWGTTQTQYHYVSWEKIVVEATPATPPPEMWVDDDWAGLPQGTEVQPGKFIGYNAFATINEAIDAAASGTLIHVYDGLYAETLYINKTLTIKAESTPVVKGSKLFSMDPGDRESVIFVENAENVVLEGLDIEGDGLGPGPVRSYAVVYENSSGTVRSCTISPNTIGDMYSIGIAGWARSDFTVESCLIKNFGRVGVYATNVAKIRVIGNEIVGQTYSQNNLVNYGIEIEDYGGASTAEIVENEVYNSDNTHESPLWSSAGIIIDIWRMYYDLPPSTVSILNNNIHNNYEAIEVVSNPYLYAHYNNIYNNRYGVWTDPDLYGGNAVFDARFNWWGDASGPNQTTTNPSGLGNDAGDYVDYSPWLDDPFEVTPRTYHVNPTGTIQEAIDEAASGDTVVVHEGTYSEQLKINKNLTVRGLAGAKLVAPDTRNTYTIPESSATFDPIIFAFGGTETGGAVSGSETITVTVEGFEVDGENKAAASPVRYVGILFRNTQSSKISSNSIHHMYDADGKGNGPQTFGILVYGYSDVTIEHNLVRDFSRGGIAVQGDDGALPDPVANIQFNDVAGNGLEIETGWWAENGIQIAWGAGGTVSNNTVTDCQVNNEYWVATGVMAYKAADGVDILDNLVLECDVGIAVVSPSFDVVSGNLVIGCSWEGIRLGWPVNNCLVTNNTVSQSWAGIGVWDASNNIIESNVLEQNEYGIYMDGASHNNMILHNNIHNNSVDGVHIEPYGGEDPSGTKIHYNSITGNGEYGVYKAGTEIVDATYNWWGNATGPYHGSSWTYMGEPYGPHYGLGDNVSDYVLYYPWIFVVHDVAVVNVSVSPTSVFAGQTVDINVTVENRGNDYENFTVTVFYDGNSISSLAVVNLAPERNTTLSFAWDTTGMPRGNYTIKAEASTVPYEIEILDNVLIDGTVEILWHDVAIVDVTADRAWAYQGHMVGINVTVTNEGDSNETVTVTLYYNITAGQAVGNQSLILLPGETQTITFSWNTAGVPYCHNYTLTAVATLEQPDNDPADNTFTDGNVKIRIIGDVDGNGTVNMYDLWLVSLGFGTTYGDPAWNPDADFNLDGWISMIDLYLVASNFGKTCP
ncbi:MAG: right-handed parallel beta-helix repeat-containing protein, partial [Candidatus Bathyarchaeia archaeon]